MGSLVKHVMTVMERIAPLRLAEKWDKVSRAQTCMSDRATVPELKGLSSGRASRGLAFPTPNDRQCTPFRPNRVTATSSQQTTGFANDRVRVYFQITRHPPYDDLLSVSQRGFVKKPSPQMRV